MSNKEDCAAYFKQHIEWNRCFAMMRKKWESYGHTGGRITFARVSEAEKRAIEKVLGRHLQEDHVSFTMREFENALQRTKFAPVTLKEVLDCYYEEEIQTNQEKAERQKEYWQKFCDRLIGYFEKQDANVMSAAFWLQELAKQKQYGYVALLSEWKKSEKDAEKLAINVGGALNKVFCDDVFGKPIAVLAAEITGNPHYFDRGSVAGTLLMYGICCIRSCDYPQNAYGWRTLLLQNGILPDEVSDTVIVYGLHLETEQGLHPAYEGFCSIHEPGVLMSTTLKKAKRVYGENDIVFIVENEMVFSYLTDHMQKKDFTLLCTAGQPRTVAVKLIEMLIEGQAQIYYSGDMDPEGIQIADRIWKKSPDMVHIWRMDKGDYLKAISEEDVSEKRLVILDSVICPDLAETAQCVREKKKAAYQENIIEELLSDMMLEHFKSNL